MLTWTTASEIDNAGFNLYRSNDGSPYQQINAVIIPAEGSPAGGAHYQFIDHNVLNRTQYWYKLEDVNTGAGSAPRPGRSVRHHDGFMEGNSCYPPCSQ